MRQSGSMCGLRIRWASVTSRMLLFVDMEMMKISTAKSVMTCGGPCRNICDVGKDTAPREITQQDSTSCNSK